MRFKHYFSLLGTIVLAFSILLTTMGAKGCLTSTGGPDARTRLVRLVLRIPEAVRVAAPNASPTLFRILGRLTDSYKIVIDNPTLGSWQIANKIWKEEAKPELEALHSTAINAIVFAFDTLLDEVELPAIGPTGAEPPPDTPIKINLKKEDIDALERAVKDALRK